MKKQRAFQQRILDQLDIAAIHDITRQRQILAIEGCHRVLGTELVHL